MPNTNHTILARTFGLNWRATAFLGAVLVSATVLIYGRLLLLPFFQDDFFVLRMTKDVEVRDLWRFLHINPAVVYFRPISMQFYFYLLQSLFGLEPLPFRLVGFCVHILNAILVWIVLFRLTTHRIMSWVGAFLFATSLMHFIALAWISEFSILLGTTMVLLTFLLFMPRTRPPWLLSILVFSLGLLVHEVVITTPAILFIYGLIWQRSGRRSLTVSITPFALIGLIYLWLRFVWMPPPLTGTYTQILSPEVIKTFMWYVAWVFQIPEEFRPQTLHVFPFELNALFVSGFLVEVVSLLFLFFIAVIFIMVFPSAIVLLLGGNQERKSIARAFLLGGSWFFFGILPFLFMPRHAYPLYAGVASIGIFFAAFSITSTFLLVISRQWQWRGIVVPLAITSWLAMSFITMRLTYNTHWAVQVASRSERVLPPFQRLRQELPAGSMIVLPHDTQLRNALLDGAAFQAIYGPGVETVFGQPPIPHDCAEIHGMVNQRCLLQHHIYVMSKEGLVL